MTTFSDNNVTTVQYQVLFVKRCYECMLHDTNIVVTESMDAAGFVSWRIADFVLNMTAHGGIHLTKTAYDTLLPLDNKGVTLSDPKNSPPYLLTDMTGKTTQYLRVEFQVLSTVAREARDTCGPLPVEIMPQTGEVTKEGSPKPSYTFDIYPKR